MIGPEKLSGQGHEPLGEPHRDVDNVLTVAAGRNDAGVGEHVEHLVVLGERLGVERHDARAAVRYRRVARNRIVAMPRPWWSSRVTNATSASVRSSSRS